MWIAEAFFIAMAIGFALFVNRDRKPKGGYPHVTRVAPRPTPTPRRERCHKRVNQ
jgi:hypothetical protein